MAAECSPGRKPGVNVPNEYLEPSKRATDGLKDRFSSRPPGLGQYMRRNPGLAPGATSLPPTSWARCIILAQSRFWNLVTASNHLRQRALVEPTSRETSRPRPDLTPALTYREVRGFRSLRRQWRHVL